MIRVGRISGTGYCIRRYAPIAKKNAKCLSNPQEIARYIVRNVLVSEKTIVRLRAGRAKDPAAEIATRVLSGPDATKDPEAERAIIRRLSIRNMPARRLDPAKRRGRLCAAGENRKANEMVIALGVIAALLLVSVIYLKKFMMDMAQVEKDLIGEIKEMKNYLKKISENQL